MTNKEFEQEVLSRLKEIRNLIDDTNKEKISKDIDQSKNTTNKIDFDMNNRAFVKKYAKNMSGQEKFVLLLAKIVKGDINKAIELDLVEKEWNKMKADYLMGGNFNRYYTTKAKEENWIKSPERGKYQLKSSWKDILNKKEENKDIKHNE